MEHTTRDGKYKIVKKCSLPLTAKRCVCKIFTDIAVIDVNPEGLILREVVPGWTPEEVQELTEPKLIYKEPPAVMEL
jgi:3-oxoacid CoA-transferase subunit B